jgi:hypothetical protein
MKAVEMDKKMKKRLCEFLVYLGIGQNKFEENVGLSRGFVNKLTGNLTLKTLDKILAKYPELNEDWLKTGEGKMLRPIVNQNNVEGDNIQGHNFTVNKSQVDKLIDMLSAKDEQISKSQEQIDRLIGVIEKISNK